MINKNILMALYFCALAGFATPAATESDNHGNHSQETHKENDNGHKDEHSGHEEHPEKVRLAEESQKMIGFELVEAQKAPLTASLEVIGETAQDSENTAHITANGSGTLEKFHVAISDVVEKGSAVASVRAKDGAVRTIVSPSHGIVMAVYLKEGDRVDEVSSIMTIVDPDVMKASFNLYEKDLAEVRLGQKVLIKTVAYPTNEFRGQIVYISPQVDIDSRKVKIRVDIENKEHLLKFGMYLTGNILIPLSEQAIVVPERSIQKIEGKDAVFVPEANQKEIFLIREVRTGRKTGGQIEILEGVEEGQRVVAKGSYYLKAELQKGELDHGHAH